jgi:ATP-dependent RNA helicase DDX35
LEAGWANGERSIVCTQPRKLAVLSVAERVSTEMNCLLGHEVGYGLRFDFRCSKETRLRFYTDGILLRETMTDPLLSRYSVIMVDEAHTRSLQSDLLLGLLKKLRKRRPDLRILITSATLEAQAMKTFFQEDENDISVGILSVQGRPHPVDICYLRNPCKDYLMQAVWTVLDIHAREDYPGDILVFLPGLEEINRAIRMLQMAIDDQIHNDLSRTSSELHNLYCLALHSSLSHTQQLQIFQKTPAGKRKVVVATNIAETSLTIANLRFVVDSCLVRLPFHDVRSGLTILQTCPINYQMAAQRAGRAGRTLAGKCFRLTSESVFLSLIEQPQQRHLAVEMARCDITSAVLTLKTLGISDILHFDFLTPPSVAALLFALEQLHSLGALTSEGYLTSVGIAMAELPLNAQWAKCLLAAREARFNVVEEMLSLSAMCAVESPFVIPFSNTPIAMTGSSQKKEEIFKKERERDRFVILNSDHLTLLRVYEQFHVQQRNSAQAWCEEHAVSHRVLSRAMDIRNGLAVALRRCRVNLSTSSAHDVDDPVEKRLRRCLVSGFFANCARLESNGVYRSLRGAVPLLPLSGSSVLAHFGTPPEWIIFGEIAAHRFVQQDDPLQNDTAWVRDASAIEPLWLAEIAPHYYDLKF